MATNYVDSTVSLRDAAWREVQASPAYQAFKALDDAVAAMGGKRIIADAAIDENRPRASVDTFARVKRPTSHISQVDAAEAVLRDKGEPLPIGRLMEAARELGATIGGDKPLANFRSALSKEDRFYVVRRNNMYFWWLEGAALPQDWQEAPDLLSKEGPDASAVGTSKEGGDGHAATMPS